MKLLILSDIHANISALNAVLNDVKTYNIDKIILLGDHIDYCMRPNETIEILKNLPGKADVNIWGNHEKAIFDEQLERFSSDRGRDFSRYTSNILNENSKNYLLNDMFTQGYSEKTYNEKYFLFIHGSLEDVFWKSISYESANENYLKYDFVVSGHSHRPNYFEKYFSFNNADTRGKKRVVFINPGSVGQPRNHNPRACYAIIDTITESVHLNSTDYDIKAEQSLYVPEIDEFYKTRLEKGI